jgi:hypothetical protein
VGSDSDVPVWLLDIDGVLNVLAPGLPSAPWPADAWERRVVRAPVPDRGELELPILTARPVLEFVTRVHEAGAEIRWHSTWGDAAVTRLAPALGLPPIELAVAPQWADEAAMWWKIPAARDVAESGRRLVWTDDQLALYRTDPLCAGELAALDRWDGALLLSPGPRAGLGPDELDRVAEFLGADFRGVERNP